MSIWIMGDTHYEEVFKVGEFQVGFDCLESVLVTFDCLGGFLVTFVRFWLFGYYVWQVLVVWGGPSQNKKIHTQL